MVAEVVKLKENSEDKIKALVILYCSNMKQVEEIKKDDGAKKNHIQTVYDALEEYWGVQIETVFRDW